MTDYEILLEEIARRIKEPKQLKTMAEAFKYNSRKATVVGNVLSDFVLDLEDRENTFYEILKQQHIDTNEFLADVQKLLDEKSGVNLEPQTAQFPAERVRQAAHSLVDPTVDDKTIQRRAKSTAENITMSFSDDYMKANAKFRSNAGLKCYITRITDGNCCKWCDSVAGRYEYGEGPEKIYRRHDNCKCSVTYENGRKRQDVWSKKSWETPETDKSEYKPEVLDYEQAKTVENENMQFKGVDKSAESGIMKMGKTKSPIQEPPDFNKYEVKEDNDSVDRVKQMLKNDFGLEEKDIQLNGIKNADALEPFVKQLNKIRQETDFVLPSIKAVDIIDGDSCCISSYKPYEKSLYISSKFFNSKKAIEDTLKEWSQLGIMPKQCKTIRYLAEHEAAHIRIPKQLIESEEGFNIFKKAVKIGVCANDMNIYEFYADSMALSRIGYSDKIIESAIKYLKQGGISQ